MKKLTYFLALSILFLLLSTSCSENSEQPNSPSQNSSSMTLAKTNETNTAASAQVGKLGLIGKIFSKNEAKVLFGNVITSSTISAVELNSALSKGGDYILLTLKNNQVVVRNEKKQHLSSERVSLKKDEPMYIFSKSMILELLKANKLSATLSKSAANNVNAEFRDGVFTLTYGDATLEMSTLCPPVCFD